MRITEIVIDVSGILHSTAWLGLNTCCAGLQIVRRANGDLGMVCTHHDRLGELAAEIARDE